jgi:hypothetical protein
MSEIVAASFIEKVREITNYTCVIYLFMDPTPVPNSRLEKSFLTEMEI